MAGFWCDGQKSNMITSASVHATTFCMPISFEPESLALTDFFLHSRILVPN